MRNAHAVLIKLGAWGPIRFISSSIRKKLLTTILFIGVVPVMVFGVIGYQITSDGLMRHATENLEGIRKIKSTTIQNYFLERQSDLTLLAETIRSFFQEASEKIHVIHLNKKHQIEQHLRRQFESGADLAQYDKTVDRIVQNRSGLGRTGESYLVSQDGKETTLKSNQVIDKGKFGDKRSGEWSSKALAGKSGQALGRAGEGIYEIIEYSVLDLPDKLNWAIITTMAVDEIISPKSEDKDFISHFRNQHGYANVFLIDATGYVLHAAKHGPDRYTNLLQGPFKNTNLGRLVAKVVKTKSFGMADFERYAPTSNLPAAFLAQPVVNEDQVKFIVAVQLSLDQINTIAQDRAGLGQTGETCLIGKDKMWRNDSYYLEELKVFSTILNPQTKVDTEAVRLALIGHSATKIIKNYRSVPVLSSWQPLRIVKPNPVNPEGIHWAAITETSLAEIQKPLLNMAKIGATVLFSAVLVVLAVAMILSDGLTSQIRRIMGLFAEIGMGNFSARCAIVSRDELGTMATSLNAMLDNTLTLIQSQQERDAIQASIMKLLEEIRTLTEGDLTARAEVTEEITGAIADSFNAMAEQLAKIVKEVKAATLEVGTTSDKISTSTRKLVLTSEKQAAQISDAIASIQVMATSIREVAEHAVQSAVVSEQSMINAQKGAEAVQNTNKAMDAIRDRVQETARAIKRLGESSQEIGNIVQIINEIADRTSILALNASIQAATAGDAGRGFAVVAEEVQRLAERSANSTKQIETLVKNIQGEINEAGTSMEESIQQVVTGSRLAEAAHTKLEEIGKVSSQLAELVQAISTKAKQQAEASEGISKTMEAVGKTTSQTSTASRQTAASMQAMAKTAKQLRVSVEAFKLEDSQEDEPLLLEDEVGESEKDRRPLHVEKKISRDSLAGISPEPATSRATI
ncbi:MAG: methyl-accepting chemotaxis protein [Desulfobacterales bacterium]|nr:MAG: methyl-accepting chemotaxis protein [Desulfobacterales bacterium]